MTTCLKVSIIRTMSKFLTITEAAEILRRSTKTLQKWDRDGKLVAFRTSTNRRYYTEQQLKSFMRVEEAHRIRSRVAYVRVSSQAQKADLKNQRTSIEDFCIASGISNVEYIEEIGGGLNFKRKHFLNLIDRICSGDIELLVLAHKDRLTRFGFDLLAYLCEKNDTEIRVLNSEKLSPETEMVQDLMTIIHCFSSRLYGLRNYRKAVKEALKK